MDPVVVPHTNPSAKLTTSLKQYQKYSLDNCYKGRSVFWALNPQPADHITITFDQPLSLSRSANHSLPLYHRTVSPLRTGVTRGTVLASAYSNGSCYWQRNYSRSVLSQHCL